MPQDKEWTQWPAEVEATKATVPKTTHTARRDSPAPVFKNNETNDGQPVPELSPNPTVRPSAQPTLQGSVTCCA